MKQLQHAKKDTSWHAPLYRCACISDVIYKPMNKPMYAKHIVGLTR